MSIGVITSKVLSGVASQVSKLPDEELEAFTAGQSVLRVVPKGPGGRRRHGPAIDT